MVLSRLRGLPPNEEGRIKVRVDQSECQFAKASQAAHFHRVLRVQRPNTKLSRG